MQLVSFRPYRTWNPFNDIQALQEEFDRIFNGGNCEKDGNGKNEAVAVWRPAIDIHETDQAYQVTVDLPGTAKEDITVTVQDGMLTIKGERKSETKEDGNGFHRIERWYGSFERRLAVPKDVEADCVEARYENGVLTVVLPKRDEVKPRQIEIKAS